jgi:phosphoserine aminotransferase
MSQNTVTRAHNFSAGPAALPLPVLEEVQRDLLAYPGAGASIMEISHRGKAFAQVHEAAKENITKLLNLPEEYRVLFVQGGASLQFAMAPMNFLHEGASADYILTGSWGSKALKEGKRAGTVREAWNGKAGGYVRVPSDDELDLDPNAAYVHFTSNETIEGVAFFDEPDTGGVPLICDASSDFLSHPIAIHKYGLLYAGAQKNVGPAGVAVVIVRQDMLERVPATLSPMLDYRNVAESDSLYNTPPAFAVYVISLTTRWLLEDIGGLERMETVNRQKAQILYDVIDGSGGFYRGHAEPASRSIMNVTWRLPNEGLEEEFVKAAKAENLDGLKGHRSVGGIRASIYNAVTLGSVQALAEFMKEFQRQKG